MVSITIAKLDVDSADLKVSVIRWARERGGGRKSVRESERERGRESERERKREGGGEKDSKLV